MITTSQKVRQFKNEVGQPIGSEPHAIEDDRLKLHLNMLASEVAELVCALTGNSDVLDEVKMDLRASFTELFDDRNCQDVVGAARNGVDVSYVVSSLLLEMGIDEDAVTHVVHEANMAKAGGPVREDGKQLAPEGWEEPDVEGELARQVSR